MFNYQDPGGKLKPAKALNNYRQLVHAQYRDQAKRPGSAFTLLEAFAELPAGTAPREDAVEWLAFPRRFNASNEQIDTDRFRFQDEYVEWRVEKSAGKLKQVTFTTDFLEYYEALAMVGVNELIAGIQAVIPGANPKVAELFGPGADPSGVLPESRAARFRNFARQNPWNNGTKGILCLGQQFNTLSALFNLVGPGAVVNLNVDPSQICGTLGGFCGADRNSDPNIATAVQNLARTKRGLALRDPVGIEIVKLIGVWKRNGIQIDINGPGQSPIWSVTRTGRRAVLKNVAGLTVDDDPITSGSQVAARLRVRAVVVSAAEADLPDWSRVGQENSTRMDQVAAGGAS